MYTPARFGSAIEERPALVEVTDTPAPEYRKRPPRRATLLFNRGRPALIQFAPLMIRGIEGFELQSKNVIDCLRH
jgi:hypothetical protein